MFSKNIYETLQLVLEYERSYDNDSRTSEECADIRRGLIRLISLIGPFS